MRKLYNLFFVLLIVFSFTSCKNSVKNISNLKDLNIYVVANEDAKTLFFRIENVSNSVYYIPDDYWCQFSTLSDTLYNEAVYKKNLNKTLNYYYSQFGKTIITNKKIEGLNADSISEQDAGVNYNQFLLPKLIRIPPHSAILKKQTLKFPYSIEDINFRVYKNNYSAKMLKDPTYGNFVKFENDSGIIISTKIYLYQ
ncbi:hypothetical protein SRABI27_04828 [Pedobacter sp. Bi27]|uniref:hypothetical protein n=1 Tax=unclassified Pedobacter TaxID=2628915 RepID=UPI001DB7BBAA|nr:MULTISPECIES: hypothetical protein [unclassified Pedobacter]CAH0277142.1 hypothetical protein SRABI36_03912 [Pedobacter sp. Bi36]CAH0294929.1 hypothetical protein SRABI126_04172 [Pedobacter sp. Bi126]CAH0312084.1 hypothetical protein SRABI27_04828 [Pedobacter sp. Bi27]